MNPMVKKVVAAVVVKEAIDKIQEMRRPKPPVRARLGTAALIAAAGGGLYYLAKSGRLRPLVERARSMAGGGPRSRSIRLPETEGSLSAPTPPLAADEEPAPVH